MFRWTLITWVGIDGIGVPDALDGKGPNAAGNSITSMVTVVWGYEPGPTGTGRWRAYFPGSAHLPRVNDLTQLRIGRAYWVAILPPGPVGWKVVLGTGE
jgi:hypothetical protein